MQIDQIRVHHGEVLKLKGFIRFVCLSDTHTKTNRIRVPDGDVLLHTGDFTNVGGPDDVHNFNLFLGSLPHQYKIVIAGNHDMSFDEKNLAQLRRDFGLNPSFESSAVKAMLTNCVYLEETGIQIMGYNIWGSPWTPTFYN